MGSEIPLFSRIIGIADAYQAMMSERPYRKAFSFKKTMEEIRKNAAIQFDPELALVFVENFSEEFKSG